MFFLIQFFNLLLKTLKTNITHKVKSKSGYNWKFISMNFVGKLTSK